MPSPAARIHRMLLAALAAMAMLTGLIPATVLGDHGLPVAATAAQRRPDDEEDDADDDTDDDDADDSEDDDADDSDSDDDSDDSDDDEVDEDALPDNVKAILKKNRDELKKAKRELREAKRSAKPAAKPKPKPKPKDGNEDEPSEREAKATEKLRKASLIAELGKAEHGITDPRAAATLALADGLAEFDDEDEPTDTGDLVEELTEKYAFLKGTAKPKPKAPNIDGGSGKRNGKAPKLSADELRAAKAAGMTPEEYVLYSSPRPKLPPVKKKQST